jgi:hypothetical protein
MQYFPEEYKEELQKMKDAKQQSRHYQGLTQSEQIEFDKQQKTEEQKKGDKALEEMDFFALL